MIPGMTLRRVEPDIDVAGFAGTLHLGNNLRLMETELRKLIQAGSRKIVLDMAQVRYADSAGLGMIITINSEIEQAGGQLRLTGCNGMFAQSLTVSHLDRVLLLNSDVDDACRNF